MQVHFLQITQIKDRVIAGDLSGTKTPARQLADDLVSDEVPLRWRAHVPAVRRAAEVVSAAEDLDAAARGAADAAAACGQCHLAVGVELTPTSEPEPLQDDTQFAYMMRHSWAVNRMWDGLIAPSDEAWQRGTRAFMEAPLHADGASQAQVDLAERVHGLAASAISQTDPAGRAGHFAAIIATCADCRGKASTTVAGPPPQPPS
jgi:cytochrome c553